MSLREALEFAVRGEEVAAGNGAIGPNTQRLHKALADIQRGSATDTFGWLRPV